MIRPLRPDDKDELIRMRLALFPDSTVVEAEDAVKEHTRGDLFIVVVEREDGSGLIAFVEAAIRSHAEGCITSPVAYLEAIWVDPAARRNGVGRALVAEVVDWARRRGLSELASDIQVDNEPSRGFHTALGFDDVGTIVCFRRPV